MLRRTLLSALTVLFACSPTSPGFDANQSAFSSDGSEFSTEAQVVAHILANDCLHEAIVDRVNDPGTTLDDFRAMGVATVGARNLIRDRTANPFEEIGDIARVWGIGKVSVIALLTAVEPDCEDGAAPQIDFVGTVNRTLSFVPAGETQVHCLAVLEHAGDEDFDAGTYTFLEHQASDGTCVYTQVLDENVGGTVRIHKSGYVKLEADSVSYGWSRAEVPSALDHFDIFDGRIDILATGGRATTLLNTSIDPARGSATGTVLVQSYDQYRKLFRNEPPKEVDFTTDSVVFVGLGRQSANAYAFEFGALKVQDIDAQGTSVPVATLTASIFLPGKSCQRLRATTPSYAFLKVKKVTEAVTAIVPSFSYQTFDCHQSTKSEDSSCNAQSLCPSTMICSGISIYDEGYCRETEVTTAWGSWTRYGLYEDTPGAPAEVPTQGELTRTLAISDQSTVPEDAFVTVEIINLPGKTLNPQNLRITLHRTDDDSDYEIPIWDRTVANFSDDFVYGDHLVVERNAGFERDNEINGDWELKLTDVSNGSARGQLVRWAIEVTSRED